VNRVVDIYRMGAGYQQGHLSGHYVRVGLGFSLMLGLWRVWGCIENSA